MQRLAVVLGGAGFVGRYAAQALAKAGWRVHGIGHGAWSREERKVWGISEWHEADVTLEALQIYAGQPELIVQCAGSGSVPFSLAHPAQDFRRTIEPTLAALEFLRMQAPQCRMVLPSSAAVYGNVAQMPIVTGATQQPVSPYGVHKQAAERLCQSYAASFGLSLAIVRLFSVYGAGLRKQLFWDACLKLSHGEASFGGSGEERRDWIHASDAGTLMAAAVAFASPDCPVANGGSGRSERIATAVDLLQDGLGLSARARFDGICRPGDPQVYEADIGEALAWGWRPQIALADGLSDYARWYLENGS